MTSPLKSSTPPRRNLRRAALLATSLLAAARSTQTAHADIIINVTGTLDLDGSDKTVGGITGNGTVTNSVASNTSALIITATSQFDGIIQNGAGTTALTKTTAGVFTLTNASTYSGPTTITGGTLLASNSSGSATGASTITLNGGALGGHGFLSGPVIAGSAPHTLAPSATLSPTATGTLTLNSLTTNANTTLLFNLLTPNANDALNITAPNDLNLSAGATLQFNDSAAPQGYYKIIQYAGAITGNPNALALPAITTTPAGKEAYLLDTHHDPGFIDIHKVLIGDANGDGIVDGGDFDIWFTHLQTSTFAYDQGDLNGDGLVDGGDFDIWFTHLQNSFGAGGRFTQTQLSELSAFLSPTQLASLSAAVPEPATPGWLGVAALILLSTRRQRSS